jgi:hypothetical protein
MRKESSQANGRGQRPPASPVSEHEPFVRPAGSVNAWKGTLVGSLVRAQGTWQPITLTRQEFTRFRAVTRGDEVRALANEYGLLWIEAETSRLRAVRFRDRPLWWWALTDEVQDSAVERVEDWIRLGGLLDLAYGLAGIMWDGSVLPSLIRFAERLERPPSPTTADALLGPQRAQAASEPWPVRLIADGAARAGMRIGPPVEADPDPGAPPAFAARSRQWITFHGSAWRIVRDPEGIPQVSPSFSVRADGPGIASALKSLLDPWLARVQQVSLVRGDRLEAGYSLPGTLLSQLWLQLARAATSDVPARECAWKRCPGPPERPGIFVKRWGDERRKRRDSQYCHPLCQHAAVIARSRARAERRRDAERP